MKALTLLSWIVLSAQVFADHSSTWSKKPHIHHRVAPFPSKTRDNAGAKCRRDTQCHTSVKYAKPLCFRGECRFRCTGKTLKYGNRCMLPGTCPKEPTRCSQDHQCKTSIQYAQPVCIHGVCDYKCQPGTIAAFGKCIRKLPRPKPPFGGLAPKNSSGVGSVQGGKIWTNPDNSSCTWDPMYSKIIDPCFFDYLFGPEDTLLLVLADYGYDDPDDGGWVNNLLSAYGVTATCELTNGCFLTLQTPTGDDSDDTVTVFLAISVIENYIAWQWANYNILNSGFLGFTTYVLPELFQQINPSKTAPASPNYASLLGAIGNVLAFVVTFIPGLATAVGAAEDSAVAAGTLSNIVANGLKGAGGVLNGVQYIQSVVPTPNPPAKLTIASLAADFGTAATSFSAQTETAVAYQLASYESGKAALQGTAGSAWCNPAPASFTNIGGSPTYFEELMQPLLVGWASSVIWQASGLYFHMEASCTDTTYENLNAGACLRNYTDPFNRVYLAEVAYYPVNFNGVEYRQDTNASRNYLQAPNFEPEYGNWQTVFVSSYICQAYYNSLDLTLFNNPYPSFNLSNPLGAISTVTPAGYDLLQYPCLFNLPICTDASPNQINQCQFAQKCCIGHASDSNCLPQVDWTITDADTYCQDNFGLDNFCASQLGGIPVPTTGPDVLNVQCA